MALDSTLLVTIGFFVLIIIVVLFSLVVFSRRISHQMRAVSENYEALKRRDSDISARLDSLHREMDAESNAVSSELKELEEQLLVLVKQRKEEIQSLGEQVNKSLGDLEKSKQYDRKLNKEISYLESTLNRLLKTSSKETSALKKKFQKALNEVKKKHDLDQRKVDKYLREFESELARYLKKFARQR